MRCHPAAAILTALACLCAPVAIAQTAIPLPSISDEGEGAPESPALEPPTGLFQEAPKPGTPEAEAAEKAFLAEKAAENARKATDDAAATQSSPPQGQAAPAAAPRTAAP